MAHRMHTAAPPDEAGELRKQVRMGHGVSSKRSLRVALVATGAPSLGHGGAALVSELSHELRSLGHRPTVLAPPAEGSRPLVARDRLADLRHAGAAWLHIRGLDEVDVVHVSSPEALPFSAFVPVPTVATVQHGRRSEMATHYLAYPAVSYVALSRRQVDLAAELRFHGVIHPGVRIERYPLGSGGRRYAFVGPLTPEHGAHLAIDAARRMRVPLVIAAQASRPEPTYIERHIAPSLGGGISCVGIVDRRRRSELLSHARALLVPTHREEPFGLEMIEAMLVGTPVIAYACGAAPEIIEDGITGFVVHDLDEMCRRMRDIGKIDRRACRARARRRWSSARMAREYAALYEEVIEHRFGTNGLATSSSRRAVAAISSPTLLERDDDPPLSGARAVGFLRATRKG
jgi:glycosyltransferase involved in cell wall biosynthesis